ncbi:MAG: GNAT family N-acetyltransferase [Prevotella sp.]|nr:GNAT family N-acetyltransferase [Prevotella sp.]
MEQSSNLRYSLIQESDLPFIKKLFGYSEVTKFYILRDDHALDIASFLDYLISAYHNHTSINYIISLNNNTPIGIIGGEIQRDLDGEVAWNVSFAILPQYWNCGYASEALKSFTNEIKHYSIAKAFLDISELNTASEKVAQKAGYKRSNQAVHMDPNHMELDVLFHWYMMLHSQREVFFSMGISAFRQKDYKGAENYFIKALEAEYEGGPNTDALCYSNMGMACSSYGNYDKAFKYLQKAKSLGLSNPSIEQELNWLKSRGYC